MRQLFTDFNQLGQRYKKLTTKSTGKRWPMWPKIIQVNESDVYIISGNDSVPKNQNSRFMKNIASVFKYNILTKRVEEKARLPTPRQAFGICHIGKYIYIAGGLDHTHGPLRSCYRYDIESDEWE